MTDEIIVYHVGMLSVKSFNKHSCNTLKGMNLAELLQLCLPGLTGIEGIYGLRLSRTSTFRTLAGFDGVVSRFNRVLDSISISISIYILN